MKSPFPKTTCLASEALDIIGRHLFPNQWTGQEVDARRLPSPQKAGEQDAYTRWRAAARELNAAFRYGHVSYWVVTDTGERIDIPAHWRERPPRISIGALFDARTRQATSMAVNSACELKRSGLGNHHDKQIAGTLYVDRCRLLSTLNKGAAEKGGSKPKYNKGLQSFIDQLSTDFADSNKPLSLSSLKKWLSENVPGEEPYETDIADCDDLEFVENTLYWKDRRGHPRSLRAVSLERYVQRAKQP